VIDPGLAGLPPAAEQGPDLGALLGAAGQGAPPSDLAAAPPGPEEMQPDPLQAVQDALHSVAAAVTALPGPQDVQDATQAMLVLSRIQTRLMQASGPQAG